MTDDVAGILNTHADMLSHEVRRDVTPRQALLDLQDKARRYDRLCSALKRPDKSVRRADNGNVVLDDPDGTPLVVLSPGRVSLLTSTLTCRLYEGGVDDTPAAYVVDRGGPTIHKVECKHDDVLTAACGDERDVLDGRMCRVIDDKDELPDALRGVERICYDCWTLDGGGV